MSDVCLLLEGTYPYVAGGVSSWVHTIIRELRDVSFSILYLGAHRSRSRKMHYEFPPNVVDFREIYLFDYRVQPEKNLRKKKKDFEALREFFDQVKKQDTSGFPDLVKIIGNPRTRSVSLYDLAYSPDSWKVLVDLYGREEEEYSFVDYFWTWRFLYLPFFSLLRTPLPPARLYHSISTGYAGVLGALCQLQYGRPFLLTEHGIYTRERRIEIARADWIYSEAAHELKVLEGHDFFKEWWISLFTFFSRLTYERADTIITLYNENKKVQIEEGAPPEKIRIIPNGVPVRGESVDAPARLPGSVLRIGFVGRVVPIKDVKTFIMACRKISQVLKNIEVYILGPADEDEEYFRECQMLVEMESLSGIVRFAGKVQLSEYYPKLDIIVLTSISEAQPLVILEAGVYGIPVVATNVGSCAELLNGSSPDDQLLGESGIVTPICNPEATAQAVIDILTDPARYARMGSVAKKRIAAHYNEDDFLASYQSLYTHYAESVRWRE